MSTFSRLKSTSKISSFHSLQGKMLFYFLGIALLPLTIATFLVDRQVETVVRASISSNLENLSHTQAQHLDEWLTNRLGEVQMLGTTEEVRSLDPARFEPVFEEDIQFMDDFSTLTVIGLDGITLNTAQKIDLSDREYFQQALQGQANISEPLVKKDDGQIMIVAASPIVVDDQVVGVVAGVIPTVEIAQALNAIPIGQTGEIYLINKEGYFVTPSRFTEELKEQGLIEERSEFELKVNSLGAQEALAGKEGVGEYTDYRGIQVLGAYHPLGNLGLGLLAEQDIEEAFVSLWQLRGMMILVSLVVAVGVAALGFFVARSLAKPVLAVTDIAKKLADGDVNQTIQIKRRDEIGLMANAFQHVVDYQQEMASLAHRLADGDLLVEVSPKSNSDLLGQAFAQMVINLRRLIGEITDRATDVDTASSQLATIADQAGLATAQIADITQQVAHGTAQQAEAVARTTTSVEQMTRALDGVAQGAQEQAVAVTKSSHITTQIAAAIQQGAANAQASAQGAADAAQVARNGATTVDANLKGMESIKAKVGLSAQKVQEMGQRSQQIGAILETIDDIASQTNLLALNAAIEAARAGEHGKGFAVVADEVRKLAEKSASATKEIAHLIKDIQQTVTEAVQAMHEGAEEVEAGVTRAGQSGSALTSILQAVETVNQQVEGIATAAQQMSASSDELMSAMGAVSTVVKENTAATEEIAAGSSEVSQAIGNIASVSKENSAAVEEVSAATEQMSAQVQEVSASAQTLSEMAQALQQLVAQFKLAKDRAHPATRSEVIPPAPVAMPRKKNGYRHEALPVIASNGRH